MMKRLFLILIVMVVFPSISQGQDLLFKFHNASKTQSYDTFFNLYQPKSVEERDSLLLFLEENKEQVLDQIDSYRWLTEMYRTYSCYINWLRLKQNQEYSSQNEDVFGNILSEFCRSMNEWKEKDRIRKQEKEERDRAWQIEQEQRVAEMKQRSALREAKMKALSHSSSPEIMNRNSRNVTDLSQLTSNSEWNEAVQMSNSIYGHDVTNKKIEQSRANDIKSRENATLFRSAQNQRIEGKEISAVTSFRQQIFIKVDNMKVVAYSDGLDGFGKRHWIHCLSGNILERNLISPSNEGYELSKEFSHYASLVLGNGKTVYVYFNY